MFLQNPDEYIFYKDNPWFAKNYVNTFIERILETEVIPDILIEVLIELENEREKEKVKLVSENYIKQKYMYPKLNYLFEEEKYFFFYYFF